MEVMNNDQFSQTETLVGQAGKTRAMGVSDDPMLMSMLSTGFYANPLRTMIQEVMFNAWDAHQMGNCQDTPIDIYINDTTGLIIRDYGPGISDDDMVPVYCIYGNSTKRKDKRQTGGFGLGCKSPFSYTESFTVTSMHEGIKSMYLVNRVSDDAEGKPGLTPLVTTQTEETGLMVAIPLVDRDREKAFRYIKDVLYLSGINANVHREDNEVVTNFESKIIRPGEYVVDDRSDHHEKKIYAVYGGVRYEIPDKEEYSQEFKFMNMISDISSLYIGFLPDTLTPLPNREGLNMSEKTKENIRVGLELCMERFQDVFEPMVHAYFRQRFDTYVEKGIEAHFALYHALGLGKGGDTNFLLKFERQMTPLVPLNTDKTVWEIALRLMNRKISAIVDVMTEKRWMSVLMKHFIRCYPDSKSLAFKALKENTGSLLHRGYYGGDGVMGTIAEWVQPTQMVHLFEFEKKFASEFTADDGFAKPKLRLRDDNKFREVVRHKHAGKRPPRKLSYAERQLSKGDDLNKIKARPRIYDDPNQIWDPKESTPIVQFFMSNVVILAKTVSALNDTQFNYRKIFSNNNSSIQNYKGQTNFDVIPAYVVHSRKGQYDAALKMLQDLGFTVLEGDEPVKAGYTRNGKPKPVLPQYRRILTVRDSWQASEIDPDKEDYDAKEDGIPLTNPTHFLYVKISDLEERYRYYGQSNKPGRSLVHQMQKIHPDIAMINNQAQADSLTKKGVKPFHDTVIQWHKGMSNKIYRFRNIVRVMKVMERSNIPDRMLKNQTIQAAMGIAKLKLGDDDFWSEMALINSISVEECSPLRETNKAMNRLILDTWIADPMRVKIEAYIKATSVFSEHDLDNRWGRLDGPKRKDYAKNVARFIRAA